MVKHEDHYVQPQPRREPVPQQPARQRRGRVAVYAATPSSEGGRKAVPPRPARIRFKAITDEAVAAALAENANEATLFFEVVDVRPLG